MNKEVYVVVVYEEERVYDAGQCSHFPTFYPVMGVFESHSSAHGCVYDYFCDRFAHLYEEIKVDGDHYVYRYDDNTYGGYALYNVQVCKKTINS
jgi:hypothetical protein